jgi:hypothetical protein
MGFMMGAAAGASVGLLYGGFTVLKYLVTFASLKT